MTSFLNIHCGCNADIIGTVYLLLLWMHILLVLCQHGIVAYYEAIVIIILFLCGNVFNYLFI